MKTLKNIKLNRLSDAELLEREMSDLKGGNNCGCGGHYDNSGGSNVGTDRDANYAGGSSGLQSSGSTICRMDGVGMTAYVY